MGNGETSKDNNTVAARVSAQAEAERYFATRASRTTPARTKALLARLGTEGTVREDDRLNTGYEVS